MRSDDWALPGKPFKGSVHGHHGRPGAKRDACRLRRASCRSLTTKDDHHAHHAPGNRFYEDIKKTNAALDALKLNADPKVHVIDLWNDMVNANGALKQGLFAPDNIHLTQDGGYELYAGKLKPLVEAILGGKPSPGAAGKPKRHDCASD